MTEIPFDQGTPTAASVGARVRQARLEAGLSQRDLSATGISFAFISRIENGNRTPSVKALRKLAPRLGVSLHWLETGEHDPAERLAQLVLNEGGRGLGDEAIQLARQILQAGAPPRS
jgi:transcriptional regulator with XRE-family HTH domain